MVLSRRQLPHSQSMRLIPWRIEIFQDCVQTKPKLMKYAVDSGALLPAGGARQWENI